MKKCTALLILLDVCTCHAQIPVEIFAGHQKTTLDVMFFRFFKTNKEENSPWLFFNRTRAAIDYSMTATTLLPQFGFTEAVSYNRPALKGFAPVAIVQVFNSSVFPKAGIQYASATKALTIFSWLVSETAKKPDLDFFLLCRFTPALHQKLSLFAQLESLTIFPTDAEGIIRLTQRTRIGVKLKEWQFGVGADLTESGNNSLLVASNIGLFLRHEF